MSRYDGTDSYTYPNTEILRNKADIRDQSALDAFEADATAMRMLELVERPLAGQFDLSHLRALHRYLFQDVYDWAGELRTVDISKGNSRFANAGMIETYLAKQLAPLRNEKFLQGAPPELFVVRVAHYMAEINAAHPFREGNGRAQRVFCSMLADQAGYFIDFETVERDEMYAVMEASFLGKEESLVRLIERITVIVDL